MLETMKLFLFILLQVFTYRDPVLADEFYEKNIAAEKVEIRKFPPIDDPIPDQELPLEDATLFLLTLALLYKHEKN